MVIVEKKRTRPASAGYSEDGDRRSSVSVAETQVIEDRVAEVTPRVSPHRVDVVGVAG